MRAAEQVSDWSMVTLGKSHQIIELTWELNAKRMERPLHLRADVGLDARGDVFIRFIHTAQKKKVHAPIKLKEPKILV